MRQLAVEYIDIVDLIAYKRNARTHSDEQIEQVSQSIKEFGFTNPVLIDEKNELIAGHGRTEAARRLGMTEVPAIRLVGLSETQKKALRIADNQLALNAGWDDELLRIELEEIKTEDFDLDLLGFSLDELDAILTSNEVQTESEGVFERKTTGALTENFGVPPFSILDTRSGTWQDRKRNWEAVGIDSGKGRDENLLNFGGIADIGKNTSIFDPVLCELIYSWFSPKEAMVIDPFAGGSVRGIVAAKLGRQYIGIDLRSEQVEENRRQWDEMEDKSIIIGDREEAPTPVWHCGDSLDIDSTLHDVKADMILSCPPYADLEKYSDDPKDLSNMEYEDFKKAYFEIIKKSCALLKKDSFACFVVGEVRDKKGIYRGFVNDTIEAFKKAGLSYYNEIILINTAGSLPLRVQRFFNRSRKIGKCHQNVLVFVKGDPKNATVACGAVEIPEVDKEEFNVMDNA